MNRSLVLDAVHLSRKMPLFPVERVVDLSEVARRRQATPTRISWTAVYMKAYALVAAECPSLRRAYRPWPWPHYYEHPTSVGMLAINREFQGEDRLCWGRFASPETTSLTGLQTALDAYQQQPVEQVFRRQVRLSKLPWPVRRMAWWLSLSASPQKRAKRVGTFSLSSLAGLGAVNRFHPTFLTTSLTYGPVDEHGQALVTLICDHRVIDGALVANALKRLESILQTEIARELSGTCPQRRAA